MWICSGPEMRGQGTYDQSMSMMPWLAGARAEKASGKRSRWLGPQPGHLQRFSKDIVFGTDSSVSLLVHNHSRDTLAAMVDLDAASAVASSIPVGVGQSSAVQTRW